MVESFATVTENIDSSSTFAMKSSLFSFSIPAKSVSKYCNVCAALGSE